MVRFSKFKFFNIRFHILSSSLPYIALIVANLIWGANFVVAKVALQEFPVMSLSFFRFLLSLILLAPFLLSVGKKEQQIKLKDIPQLVILGLTMITFSIIFFYEGLIKTTAINASVLTLVVPLLSVLVGWIFLKEKLYLINLVGIFFGILGSLTILQLPLLLLGGFSPNYLLGNILIILSGISFVAGTFFSKKMLGKYSVLTITAVAFAVGAASLFIPAINDYFQNPLWPHKITILGFLSLFYITVLSSISAFFLMEWGLKKMSLSRANLFQYLEPAVAATLAVPILGERISFSFIIGTCLIILGVYWGTLGKPEHHYLRHKHHRT